MGVVRVCGHYFVFVCHYGGMDRTTSVFMRVILCLEYCIILIYVLFFEFICYFWVIWDERIGVCTSHNLYHLTVVLQFFVFVHFSTC